MVWTRFWRWIGLIEDADEEQNEANGLQTPAVAWVEAGDSPWGVRVLDMRPFVLNRLAASGDPQCALNAMSFAQDDGTSFIGQEPSGPQVIGASLRFPIDRELTDGPLFIPGAMEQKWALFHHGGEV